ncbi:MAG: GPW/gp25 family protein [Bacteroidales bacterium]|nr:GPW/gp25 family protein [Bacteroidales bacterium]
MKEKDSQFYKIPLEIKFTRFADGRRPKHPEVPVGVSFSYTSSLKKSIDEFVELIILTRFEENKYDYYFGFCIWDQEFESINISSFNTREDPRHSYEESLSQTIMNYEKRLKDVSVEILFEIDKKKLETLRKRIKFLVAVTVQGTIQNKSKDKYLNTFHFSMGPLYK